MALKKTYQIKKGPPPPDIDSYANWCEEKWRELLNSDPEEKEVQAFLEQNPAMVPGAWTPGSKSGHGPMHLALISQPILPGLRSRRPDYMWLAKHSLAVYPTLIEIEKPNKKIFTKGGNLSAAFTQARNQLAQWRTWLSNPTNLQRLAEIYGIPYWTHSSLQIIPHMILIYGRRSEFEDFPELALQRGSLLPGADEELMSFDRLEFDKDLLDAITVRMKRDRRYEALSIPPAFMLGPSHAERLLLIDNMEKVLQKTPLISKKRKAFLKERILYWREWAREDRSGFMNSGDWE